jgi:hypothetical protein
MTRAALRMSTDAAECSQRAYSLGTVHKLAAILPSGMRHYGRDQLTPNADKRTQNCAVTMI